METTYKPTYEQLEAALNIARLAITQAYQPTPDLQWLSITLANIATTLAPPPPTYKEVTVERWECDVCGKVRSTDPHDDLCFCYITGMETDKFTFTKLTGTRRVPVKQPVRKRVDTGWVDLTPKGGFVDWEGRSAGKAVFAGTEASGKRVNLIAEWEE